MKESKKMTNHPKLLPIVQIVSIREINLYMKAIQQLNSFILEQYIPVCAIV